MYPSAPTMYQGHWQQNYYNGYQPVEYPQHYYNNNNSNLYGYYSRSTSSSSSSMDSLNDPYYYSHPVTAIPRAQEFVYFAHPVSPTYSPSRSPSYSPQPPTYSPSYPQTMPFINSNSFSPMQPVKYMQTNKTSLSKPKDNGKTEFHIGMKPAERLQWIRETFPKQPLSTTKSSKSPWASAVPVKPLRRPRISTTKS